MLHVKFSGRNESAWGWSEELIVLTTTTAAEVTRSKPSSRRWVPLWCIYVGAPSWRCATGQTCLHSLLPRALITVSMGKALSLWRGHISRDTAWPTECEIKKLCKKKKKNNKTSTLTQEKENLVRTSSSAASVFQITDLRVTLGSPFPFLF